MRETKPEASIAEAYPSDTRRKKVVAFAWEMPRSASILNSSGENMSRDVRVKNRMQERKTIGPNLNFKWRLPAAGIIGELKRLSRCELQDKL